MAHKRRWFDNFSKSVGDPSFLCVDQKGVALTLHGEQSFFIFFFLPKSRLKFPCSIVWSWWCNPANDENAILLRQRVSHLKTMIKVKIQFSYLISWRKSVFSSYFEPLLYFYSFIRFDLFFRKNWWQTHQSYTITAKRKKDCKRFYFFSISQSPYYSLSFLRKPKHCKRCLLVASNQSIKIRQWYR